MASYKDTFEAHTFRANTFASGTWRGTGVTVPSTADATYFRPVEGPSKQQHTLEGPSTETYAVEGPSTELYDLAGN